MKTFCIYGKVRFHNYVKTSVDSDCSPPCSQIHWLFLLKWQLICVKNRMWFFVYSSGNLTCSAPAPNPAHTAAFGTRGSEGSSASCNLYPFCTGRKVVPAGFCLPPSVSYRVQSCLVMLGMCWRFRLAARKVRNNFVQKQRVSRAAFRKQITTFVWGTQLLIHIWPHGNIPSIISLIW